MTQTAPAPSRLRRFWDFPLTRIVVGVFAVALAAGLSSSAASAHLTGTSRMTLPNLAGSAAALLAYWAWVRLTERREVVELSVRAAVPELAAGLALGVVMVVAVIGTAALAGAYSVVRVRDWDSHLLVPLTEMTLVGVLEELLCRGLLFRIAEKALGSWAALVLSALLFGTGHLPGTGAGFLAVAIAVLAGAFFAAAYLFTRRLWLCIGIHIAWNYTLGTVFSVAVSGRESRGFVDGAMHGPGWLTGGAYGLEASLLTLIVLLLIGGFFLRAAARTGSVRPHPRRKDPSRRLLRQSGQAGIMEPPCGPNIVFNPNP